MGRRPLPQDRNPYCAKRPWRENSHDDLERRAGAGIQTIRRKVRLPRWSSGSILSNVARTERSGRIRKEKGMQARIISREIILAFLGRKPRLQLGHPRVEPEPRKWQSFRGGRTVRSGVGWGRSCGYRDDVNLRRSS